MSDDHALPVKFTLDIQLVLCCRLTIVKCKRINHQVSCTLMTNTSLFFTRWSRVENSTCAVSFPSPHRRGGLLLIDIMSGQYLPRVVTLVIFFHSDLWPDNKCRLKSFQFLGPFLCFSCLPERSEEFRLENCW